MPYRLATAQKHSRKPQKVLMAFYKPMAQLASQKQNDFLLEHLELIRIKLLLERVKEVNPSISTHFL